MDVDMEDAGDGTVWMTYDELATARCISRTSAIRLSFRRKWPRRKGNHNEALIAVPPAAQAPPPDATHDAIPAVMGADSPDPAYDSRDLKALTREQQRADLAEARAERAEDQATEARTLAEQRAADLTAALVRAAKAESIAEGLREALAEARRPAWRRWLGWD